MNGVAGSWALVDCRRQEATMQTLTVQQVQALWDKTNGNVAVRDFLFELAVEAGFDIRDDRNQAGLAQAGRAARLSGPLCCSH